MQKIIGCFIFHPVNTHQSVSAEPGYLRVTLTPLHSTPPRPNGYQGIAALCLTEGPIRVIIVDSVIALFRVDFSGRGDLSVRQQKLGRHLSSLLQMAAV